MIDELVLLPNHVYIILSDFTRAHLAEVGAEVEQAPWCVEYDAPCGSITYRRESPAL